MTPDSRNKMRTALARHLWSEFATGTTEGRTFDEQNPSVQNWWNEQADEALRIADEASA